MVNPEKPSDICKQCAFEDLRAMAASREDTLDAASLSQDQLVKELELHHVMLSLQGQELELVKDELASTRQRYVGLFAFSPTAFATCTQDLHIREANAAFYALLEEGPHDFDAEIYHGSGKSLLDLFSDDDRASVLAYFKNVFSSTATSGLTLRLIKEDKSQHWIRLSARRMDALHGSMEAVLSFTDLNQEKESLAQSETLLRELNHRIKNSLGLILSILQMESMRGRNQVDIKSIIIRVHALSKVYERLYQKELSDTLDTRSYIEEIFESLVLGFAGPQHNLNLICRTEALIMPAKKTMNLGLIITELVSNALRYGFPESWYGELGLETSRDQDHLTVRVWNNGQKGLPPDFTLASHAGTGLQVVHHLSRQLGGDLHVTTGLPTVFTLRFLLE